MNLIDQEQMKKVVQLGGPPKQTPGGSCANTLRGFAWLAQDSKTPPIYMGAVGKDIDGDTFESILQSLGVIPALGRKDMATGKSAIIVTPDYERTMFTYLGACREFEEADVRWDAFKDASYLYITGYMWDTENQKTATKRAMETAIKENVKIVFDLADPFVIHRSGEELKEWLPGKVDILFANNEELSVMTGKEAIEDILEASRYLSPTIVMKVGADGCIIVDEKERIDVPGKIVVPHDTTAAGDSFAAGYLFGIANRFPPYRCGELANELASNIVTVEGCDYDSIDRKKILEGFADLL
jgi:sugar/nucleoside kinase (ribokinase family)